MLRAPPRNRGLAKRTRLPDSRPDGVRYAGRGHVLSPHRYPVLLLLAAAACADDRPTPIADAGPRDLGFLFPDAAAQIDAQSPTDFGVLDAAVADALVPDSGSIDASPRDTGPRDSGEPGACGPARVPTEGDLIVNEILADPGPELANGDANLDGVRSATDDEFIELANVSEDALLLENITIYDGADILRHTFGPLTLGCGEVIVVFGGGDAQSLTWRANWVVADSGGISLNNDGDDIWLGFADGTGEELGVTSYGAEAGGDQSIVRVPELDGEAPFVRHAGVAGSNGLPFSPGTRVDGSAFPL